MEGPTDSLEIWWVPQILVKLDSIVDHLTQLVLAWMDLLTVLPTDLTELQLVHLGIPVILQTEKSFLGRNNDVRYRFWDFWDSKKYTPYEMGYTRETHMILIEGTTYVDCKV